MTRYKLVRDSIPAIIEQQGRQPKTHMLEPADVLFHLLVKLDEETQELKNAVRDKERAHVIEEAADVLEVLRAVCKQFDATQDELLAENERKRKALGGFTTGVLLGIDK